MSTLSPKQALFAQFAAIAKALGHEHRLELLELLAQGERTVEVLGQLTGLSVANASQPKSNASSAATLTSLTIWSPSPASSS
jgi:ArsR family transcriptional regulator